MTNISSQLQLTLFLCLLAAICFHINDCTIAHSQTIHPALKTDGYSAQSESSAAVNSTSDNQLPPGNQPQAENYTAKKSHFVGKKRLNPFRPTSDKSCETANTRTDSIKLPKARNIRASINSPVDSAKQTAKISLRKLSDKVLYQSANDIPNISVNSQSGITKTKGQLASEAAFFQSTSNLEISSSNSGQTKEFALAQSTSKLPANPSQDSDVTWDFELQTVPPEEPIRDSSVIWDFELQSKSDDRSRSLTRSTKQPTHPIKASTLNNARLIYVPAVPAVDSQGRYILKPKVMLSSGEAISDIPHGKRTGKRKASPPSGPVAGILNRYFAR